MVCFSEPTRSAMATITSLSFLIISTCCSLSLGIDTNYLFNSDSFPADAAIPTLSDGNLGFTVFSDAVYLNGVFNGHGTHSRRARIPNYANLQLALCRNAQTNPPHCSYQLDIKFGRFRTVYSDPNGQMRLIHSVYPHRFFSSVIVNHFRIQRLAGLGVLRAAIELNTGLPSADITFQPAQRVTIRDRTFTFQCGRTNEVEDPVLQTSGSEVCIYFEDFSTIIELPEASTAKEISIYTVFARSRAEAENELELLTLSNLQNNERIQTERMNTLWEKYGITVSGNDELDRAIKASAFQLFNNIPEMFTFNNFRTFGISPSGIGRPDFQGHVMWDFDMWMFPLVLLMDPLVARRLLQYRTSVVRGTLADNAAMNGFEGWQFPWASAMTGREVSPFLEAATLQHHITADVAFAIRQFMYATDSISWMMTEGCELLFETARFWKNRTVYNPNTDKFDIPSVTGPDEMNRNVTNDVFTNAMAAHNLFLGEYAGCLCQMFHGITDETLAELIRVAKSLHLPYDEAGGFNPQFEGYTEGTKIGQADAVLLSYPLDIPMNDSIKRRNLEVYSQATVENTPAMTWSMHAIGWLELNELDRAAEDLHRSYQPYMRAPFHVWNQRPEGSGSALNFVTGAAGLLQTIVNGYGGIRVRNDEMILDRPRLPPGTSRLYIPEINYKRFRFSLEVRQDGTFAIEPKSGAVLGMSLFVDGQEVQLCSSGEQSCIVVGSKEASLKLLRSDSDRCTLKPTTLNMKLADQESSGDVSSIRPIIIFSTILATVFNKYM